MANSAPLGAFSSVSTLFAIVPFTEHLGKIRCTNLMVNRWLIDYMVNSIILMTRRERVQILITSHNNINIIIQ